VPAGRIGQLSLRFTQPRYVKLSTLVSVIALVVLFVICVPRKRRIAIKDDASL